MNELSKLCKDCKHSVPARFLFFPIYQYAKCAHPSSQRLDLVTGEVEMYSCRAERNWGCGPTAINFVARRAKKELA